jgi:hypothetical protein
LDADVEAAQTMVVGLGKVSNCDLANKTELYGTSHRIMAEVTVNAVVSVGCWWPSCCSLDRLDDY